MADSITNCRRIDGGNANGRYLVFYELEDSGNTTQVEIQVLESDMTLITDMNEVETLANAEATIYKTDWVATLAAAPTDVDDATINGPVTL